jgi:hypothetical protein
MHETLNLVCRLFKGAVSRSYHRVLRDRYVMRNKLKRVWKEGGMEVFMT